MMSRNHKTCRLPLLPSRLSEVVAETLRITLLCLVCAQVAVADDATESPAASSALPEAVACLGAAFNAHDAEAMGGCVHEDIEVYYIDASGTSALGTKGRQQLVGEMVGYFRSLPTVRSEFQHSVQNGRFVSLVERVRWSQKPKDGGAPVERTQSSSTVYELEADRVRRVWYYPAQQ